MRGGMAGDPVTDLLDHKLSLTDVDSRGSSYLPFLEPQAAVARSSNFTVDIISCISLRRHILQL